MEGNRYTQNPNSKYVLPLGSRAGGLSFTLVVIINLLVGLVGSVIITLGGLANTDAAKYISVLVSPITVSVVFALAVKLAKQPARAIVPVKARPKYFVLGLLLIFGLFFSLTSVNGWFIKLLELMGYEQRKSFLPDVTGLKVLPVIIVFAVLPAIFEEIMFRGIILFNTEEDAGTVRTIFLSGLCFSLYHTSVEQTIYQFVCGSLFAFLALRSRSVTPTVIIHFINNALIIALSAAGLIDPVTDKLIMPWTVEIVLTVVASLALAGAVVWLILDKTELKKCKKGGVAQFFIFAAVGIGATVLLWIAGLFVK